MKKFFVVLVFLVIFGLLYKFFFSFLGINANSIDSFYKEPKDSMDVVYIGSSTVYAHFNSALAFHEYGFATGMISGDSQPFAAARYLIDEGEKQQHPKLFIIDISKVDAQKAGEGSVRAVINQMPFSKNKINLTKTLLKYSNVDKKDYISFYLSFLSFHSSWKYISKDNYSNGSLYKGHMLTDFMIIRKSQVKPEWNDELMIPLSKDGEQILEDFISFVNESKLNILCVIPPKIYKKTWMGNINYAQEKLMKNGIDVLNFNKISDVGIDYSQDFYNEDHLNAWGSAKFTRYFADYLDKNYNLKDHRKDKKYNSWEKEYKRYIKNFETLTGEKFI